MVQVLEAEHLRSWYASVMGLLHDVRLVDEPLRGLTCDPYDDGVVASKVGAVGLVHPTTCERDEALDVAAAD